MNEREELAAIARRVLLSPPEGALVTDAIADAILEAGYARGPWG